MSVRYVVIGSSAAGVNAVREIRKNDRDGSITLISADKQIYSRCILHHYLGGIRTAEELNFAEEDFADRYDVNWIKGCAAAGIDTKNRQVGLEDGRAVSYDRLLIATGSHTFVPTDEMRRARNAAGFRNLEDIDGIRQAITTAKHVVVMGAGLVGLDTVSGLLEQGVKPVVVELADHLLCRQLDKKAADAYEKAFEAKGVKQYYGIGIQQLVMDEHAMIQELVLSDGSLIRCDYLIMTAGVRANTAFLEGSGLETDRFGLVFNGRGETNIPGVYGAGDVSGRAPIWPAAVKEGIIAGSNMTGEVKELGNFFASKSTMNFLGIQTLSLGNPVPEDDTYIVESEETGNTYKKIIHKDGRITGAVLQGDLDYSGILQQLIAHDIDVSKVKKSLFDIDYSDFFHIKENFEYDYREVQI